MKEFDLITFDCYGTLIDWESGIYEAFRREAAKDRLSFPRDAVLSAYLAAEKELEAGPYRPYREVLSLSARKAASTLGWELGSERMGFLAESLPGWPPFPDTSRALERLSSRYHLGILSNIDDTLLLETMRHFRVSFEIIVTAEQVRSYKPRSRHFEEARRRKGEARWLHAAQSLFYDVEPALEMKIPVAWINRKREAFPETKLRPLYTTSDLEELADLLLSDA